MKFQAPIQKQLLWIKMKDQIASRLPFTLESPQARVDSDDEL